jgi:hypothetical protein
MSEWMHEGMCKRQEELKELACKCKNALMTEFEN